MTPSKHPLPESIHFFSVMMTSFDEHYNDNFRRLNMESILQSGSTEIIVLGVLYSLIFLIGLPGRVCREQNFLSCPGDCSSSAVCH